MQHDDAPLLFIHGIKGGRLRGPDGLRWLGASQGLGWDRRPLTLPLTWGEGRQDRDGLEADGPLERVLWVPVYSRFLAHTRRQHPKLSTFSYDWRRELPEAAALLAQRLRELRAEHGRPARIVAHSMGGLVSWLALREEPELAAGLLVAGTPFGTGVAFTADAHLGVPTGLNRHILSVAAVNSWSSHPVFFPSSGDAGLRGAGGALEHDWYEVSSWEDHGLGVFAEGVVADVGPYRSHLAQALQRARATRALLEDPGELAASGLPVAVLRGSNRATPGTVLRDGPRAVRGWDVHSGETTPGDGRVRRDATEPPGLAFKVFETDREHASLLDDHAAVDAALGWLATRGT